MTDRHEPPLDATERETLDQLIETVKGDTPVSPDMVEMIMAGYDISNIEAIMAELIEDTALTGALVPVRSGELAVRLMTFEAEGVRFEFEIGPQAPEVVGHVDPVVAGVVVLETAAGRSDVTLDDLGRFEFGLDGTAPFRLRLIPSDGTQITTDWITP